MAKVKVTDDVSVDPPHGSRPFPIIIHEGCKGQESRGWYASDTTSLPTAGHASVRPDRRPMTCRCDFGKEIMDKIKFICGG